MRTHPSQSTLLTLLEFKHNKGSHTHLHTHTHTHTHTNVHVQTHTCISRVPDQNGVSQARYIVEIHHSGRKPLIYKHTVNTQFADRPCQCLWRERWGKPPHTRLLSSVSVWLWAAGAPGTLWSCNVSTLLKMAECLLRFVQNQQSNLHVFPFAD